MEMGARPKIVHQNCTKGIKMVAKVSPNFCLHRRRPSSSVGAQRTRWRSVFPCPVMWTLHASKPLLGPVSTSQRRTWWCGASRAFLAARSTSCAPALVSPPWRAKQPRSRGRPFRYASRFPTSPSLVSRCVHPSLFFCPLYLYPPVWCSASCSIKRQRLNMLSWYLSALHSLV